MNDSTPLGNTVWNALESFAICRREAEAAATEAERTDWLSKSRVWLDLADELMEEEGVLAPSSAPVYDVEVLEGHEARTLILNGYASLEPDNEPTPPVASAIRSEGFEWEAAA